MKNKQNKIKSFLASTLTLSITILISILIILFYECKFDLGTAKTYDRFYIYDNTGKKIDYFENGVNFRDLPKHLIEAFIAIEDTEFFNHYGFSIRSIIRSFWKNIKEKKIVQGGSTITEQYVKLYYGDLRKNMMRKLKNLIISILIEFHHTKEEIFEAYCNALYFGKNIYGISDASRIFFNKSYKELTINEAALIAGIVQRPEYFNPLGKENPEAIKKKNLVLKRMCQEHFITEHEYKKNTEKKIVLTKNSTFPFYKSIAEASQFFLENLENTENQEYDIYATIDEKIQKKVSQLFDEQINEQKKRIPQIDGAVIVTEYKTGKIKAFVNGQTSRETRNKTFEWRRQIGSVIKPFITYFAFSHGDSKETTYDDNPLEERFSWNPSNYERSFKGQITIKEALFSSNNIVPIRILDKFDIKNFIPLISPFFRTPIRPYLSLALGCIEASASEVIGLFNALLNKGEKKTPYFIEKIIKKSGGLFYEHEPEKDILIFSNEEARENTKEILASIGKALAKKYHITYKEPIYAKTGTTNNAVSCWFFCANNTYSIAIVIGTESNKKLFPHGFTSTKEVAPLGLKILHFLENLEK
jgi:membrane peptidoglycan carboxypeptidase